MERISHSKLSKPNLLSIISQSVFDCGFNVIYLSSGYPFKLKIYNENESYNILVYIMNVTHGGGYKRAANEYRVQIGEITVNGVRRFLSEPNFKTLILGYWKEIDVFAGYDFNKHKGIIGKSTSIQIRKENLEKQLH
jgi:putative restriction endonuclease